jgi:hypothetical protein
MLMVAMLGCPTGHTPIFTKESAVEEKECAEAEAHLGHPACVHRVDDNDTWKEVTIPSSSVDQLQVGKYLVPAVENARLPGLFLDVNYFLLHYDFLVESFPISSQG